MTLMAQKVMTTQLLGVLDNFYIDLQKWIQLGCISMQGKDLSLLLELLFYSKIGKQVTNI